MAVIEKINAQPIETDFGDNRPGVIVLSRLVSMIRSSGGEVMQRH